MLPTRNQVFDATFALFKNAAFGGVPFVTMSRKFKHFADVPSEQQPAFYQTEPEEDFSQKKGMPYNRIWYVSFTIYFRSDPSDDDDIPSFRMNDFVDWIESLFPSDDPDQCQTLGGLVEQCWIEGTLIKVDGTDNGQGLIVVPVAIRVP